MFNGTNGYSLDLPVRSDDHLDRVAVADHDQDEPEAVAAEPLADTIGRAGSRFFWDSTEAAQRIARGKLLSTALKAIGRLSNEHSGLGIDDHTTVADLIAMLKAIKL